MSDSEHEIEAKIKITPEEAQKIRLWLDDKLSLFGYKHLERNAYYDAGTKLQKAGKALRIRVAQGQNTNDLVALTFKGPVAKGKYKAREEVEMDYVHLGMGDRMDKLLRGLGFKPTFTYLKRRTEWKHYGTGRSKAKIALDELPHLGFYLEIEGQNEQIIDTVIETMKSQKVVDLTKRKPIQEGYPTLMSNYVKRHPKRFPDPQNVEFPNVRGATQRNNSAPTTHQKSARSGRARVNGVRRQAGTRKRRHA